MSKFRVGLPSGLSKWAVVDPTFWSFPDTAGCTPRCRHRRGHHSFRYNIGTGIYLIPFAPHAFVHERQGRSRELLSPLAFLPILTDFTPTPAIPFPSPGLESAHRSGDPDVEHRDLTEDAADRLRTLYAQ